MATMRRWLILAWISFQPCWVRADIYRWDDGALIPGTEGIAPGPAIDLSYWNTDSHNLKYADFSAGLDLSSANFDDSWLDHAAFQGADLTNASLGGATLTGANLTGALVTGTQFGNTTSRGFTAAQLYSTQSYAEKNLSGIGLGANDLTGWDFREQNLAKALVSTSTFTNASLAKARLTDALVFSSTFTNANFTDADLTNANFIDCTFTNANLTGAVVTGAQFNGATSRGFTAAQLYSTQSYADKNLDRIGLNNNDLTGWDFHDQNLRAGFQGATLTNANLAGANLAGANFTTATLTGANFTGAVVAGTYLWSTTSHGFTADQLYSTRSYAEKNLVGIGLRRNDLSGWDFHEQNLAHANLQYAVFTNADLAGASLVNSYLTFATFANADLEGADVRGAIGAGLSSPDVPNTILPSGQIMGLNLADGRRLVVRDDDPVPNYDEMHDPPPYYWLAPRPPIAVRLRGQAEFSDGGELELRFEADSWDSLISFDPGIPVELGGTLELNFVGGVDVTTQIGRTIRIFDWTGVAPTGAFSVSSVYPWDVSALYTTGEVTLLLPGDTNGDETVDLNDLNNVRNNFGGPGLGDTNNDGTIDLVDLNNVRNFFGVSATQPVPEPSTFAIACLAMVYAAMVARRGSSRRHAR